MINKKYLRKILLEGNFDLLHITLDLDDWWLPYLKGKPFVYTVHDLIPELFARGSNSKHLQMRKKLVFKAARIIAVSENTKNDCIKIWKVPSEKIDVIYHAPSVMDLGRSSMVETGDYILYVGGRGGYKNFRWFINAVTPILKARPSLKVFCTGQPFSKEELKWLTELNIETQVYAKFVDSRDMFNLYHNAKAFVYPSRYEGFGIPILDAFKAGCPVILSNSSCFKEVGGDAALYFELDDPGSLQKTITDVLDRPLARERMVVCGLERVKEFSWMQASLATARVYDSAFKTSL